MKKRYLFIILAITFIIEIVLAVIFLNNISTAKNDTVKINEIVHKIEDNYPNDNEYPDYYNYSIIDNEGNLSYSNYNNPTSSINEAILNGDLIIDLNNLNICIYICA